MCRMNTCKPSVSKGRSCNKLVQILPRPCIWYLSVATLAPRSRSTICTQVPPKMSYMEPHMWTQTKRISTKLVFFPTWESAHVYFWWILKHQMNQSSAKKTRFSENGRDGFDKEDGVTLKASRDGFRETWRTPKFLHDFLSQQKGSR